MIAPLRTRTVCFCGASDRRAPYGFAPCRRPRKAVRLGARMSPSSRGSTPCRPRCRPRCQAISRLVAVRPVDGQEARKGRGIRVQLARRHEWRWSEEGGEVFGQEQPGRQRDLRPRVGRVWAIRASSCVAQSRPSAPAPPRPTRFAPGDASRRRPLPPRPWANMTAQGSGILFLLIGRRCRLRARWRTGKPPAICRSGWQCAASPSVART